MHVCMGGNQTDRVVGEHHIVEGNTQVMGEEIIQ